MVGILKKIYNFAIAMARYQLEGGEKVEEHVWQARMNICAACPLLQNKECGLCGCPVERKALLSTEKCPEGKWQRERPPVPASPKNTKPEAKSDGNLVQKKTSTSFSASTRQSKGGCQKCKKRTK